MMAKYRIGRGIYSRTTWSGATWKSPWDQGLRLPTAWECPQIAAVRDALAGSWGIELHTDLIFLRDGHRMEPLYSLYEED